MRRRTLLAVLLLAPTSVRAAGKSKGGAPESPYLRMDPLAATVRLTGGRRGVLTLEPSLEAADPALRERATASAPRPRAAWFDALQRYAAGLKPGAAPDPLLLGSLMQTETDRVLGRRGATFLIGSVMVG